ncbi:cytoskeleton protein RodZ [Trabulsiella odontotermitis]|uniref:HTH cro/C1-type domain-containing protein n=1 Tax=Trabulsiella odontotermitis TaxID=379893 RepID=A0A0L0GIF8_9ENTR|nr:cytoskeleton protein RodZ [Trabulsiella odontotermitis]KNC88930.1 hypothetical protein GM31_08885 [Trabulsiella odontotermitis]
MNTEATHDQHEAQTTGARLRKAREQLGLSQQAVAERLCLKVSTVRDLEDDKAPADLASTFLRGYIRSYARLVHIPEEELLPIKETPVRMTKVAPMQGMTLGKRRKRRDGWLMSFTWLVLFVVIGLTGAWWWQNHKAQQEEISSMADQSSAELNATNTSSQQSIPLDTGATQTPDATAQTTPVEPPAPDASASATPAPTATAPADNAQANAVVPPSQATVDNTANTTAPATPNAAPLPTDQAGVAAQTAGTGAIVMNFNADCWLEVSDATGKKLFSGLQRKDGTLNLTGQAPYKLKIGAPAAVQIQYQGKPVDLSRFIRTNQVARLTLNAEQSPAQ